MENVPSTSSTPKSAKTPASPSPSSSVVENVDPTPKESAATTPSRVISPDYIIVIKNAVKGTLHVVLDPTKGPGALKTFDTGELAQSFTDDPKKAVFKTNPYWIIPVV